MQLTHFSRNLIRLGLACCIASTVAFGCSQATPPTPERKATLARMQRTFQQLKAMQKFQPAQTSTTRTTEETTPFSMVGMWMTTFTADGEVVDAGFDVWHSDGTQILNDNPPPVTGNVCIGIWQQTGPLTYELKHPTWAFDPDTSTALIGIGYILEKVTLDASGDKYTGTSTFEGYDLDGNHVFHQEAAVSGERIKMDPPPDAGPLPQLR